VTSGAVPFFRCFWQTAGEHSYTVQANCETAQARNEGQLGCIAAGQDAGTVPPFRLHQPSGSAMKGPEAMLQMPARKAARCCESPPVGVSCPHGEQVEQPGDITR